MSQRKLNASPPAAPRRVNKWWVVPLLLLATTPLWVPWAGDILGLSIFQETPGVRYVGDATLTAYRTLDNGSLEQVDANVSIYYNANGSLAEADVPADGETVITTTAACFYYVTWVAYPEKFAGVAGLVETGEDDAVDNEITLNPAGLPGDLDVTIWRLMNNGSTYDYGGFAPTDVTEDEFWFSCSLNMTNASKYNGIGIGAYVPEDQRAAASINYSGLWLEMDCECSYVQAGAPNVLYNYTLGLTFFVDGGKTLIRVGGLARGQPVDLEYHIVCDAPPTEFQYYDGQWQPEDLILTIP